MHVLLPPSETKASGGRGRPLRTREITGPLAAPRLAMLHALGSLLQGSALDAASALLIPDGVAPDALVANATVLDAPTRPALRRYAGVVYDGLGFDELSLTAQRVARRRTLIFSGLFGVVRGDELVPAYRVPSKAVLPGIGVAGTYWRRVLDDVLPTLLGRGLVIDLRSTDYAAMWRPRGALADRVLTVRVLSPLPRGGYGVVSYPSKFAKGRLCAALVTRVAEGSAIETPDDVGAAWLACGGRRFDVEGRGRIALYAG